jgi:hypothetical protein
MTYSAKVVKVMIASPSDVTQERLLVREVIDEWNAVNSEQRAIILVPIAWETHSSPDLAIPAQQVINEQVLKGCDLLVGIFWTRFGSPTGTSPSGTVEEIRRHIDSGGRAMIYFSRAPASPNTLDLEQQSLLREFQQKCKGLVAFYDSLTDFRVKLARQLAHAVNEDFTLEGDAGKSDESTSVAEISEEARALLLATSEDPHGHLYRLQTLDKGMVVETNGKRLCSGGNPRSEALWDSAIDELIRLRLLATRGGEGKVFGLTKAGYELADKLKARP